MSKKHVPTPHLCFHLKSLLQCVQRVFTYVLYVVPFAVLGSAQVSAALLNSSTIEIGQSANMARFATNTEGMLYYFFYSHKQDFHKNGLEKYKLTG